MPDNAQFSIAGIPVRVEPVFFVIAAVLGFNLIDQSATLLLVWIGVMFVSILVHELGHGLMLKSFGAPSRIVLQGFGGVTVSTRPLDRTRSVLVSVAGSCAALLLLWLPARTLHGSDWYLHQDEWLRGVVAFTAFANLWWSVGNLLPIRPLDGGNVVTQLFGERASRRVSVVAAVGGALWAFTHDQQFAGFFALLFGWQSYQEIAAERGASAGPP
jgi:stage IV sporulation protein FB